jgi:hypothetical protein
VAVDGQVGLGVVRVVRAEATALDVIADTVLGAVDLAVLGRDAVQPVVVVVGHHAVRQLGPEPAAHVVETVETARRAAVLVVHDDVPVKATGLGRIENAAAEVDAVVHVVLQDFRVPAASDRVELDLRLRIRRGLGVDDGIGGLAGAARSGLGGVLDAHRIRLFHVAVPALVVVALAGIGTLNLHGLGSPILEVDVREVRVAERLAPHRLEAELRGGDVVEDAELVELAVIVVPALVGVPVGDVLTHRVTVFGCDRHGSVDGHGVVRRTGAEGEGQQGHEKQACHPVHGRSSALGVVVVTLQHDRFLHCFLILLSKDTLTI